MPNWTFNKLTISSQDVNDLNEVKELLLTEGKLTFNKFIEMPQDVKDSQEVPSPNPLWYQWSCDNWGTKWDACDVAIETNNNVGYSKTWHELVITFNTAWSAPMPVIGKIFKATEDFDFEYEAQDECGEWRITVDNEGHVAEWTNRYVGCLAD